MSAVWVVGGLYFWWRRERLPDGERKHWPARWPPVTILVPCHNEEKTVGATCENLRRLDYPDYRVVLIDDASRDGTLEALRREARLDRRFHVLRLLENQGK
ncbi:MAG: glycosyltransferase, partial [Firmicutes bacterium]|nr:glycosyltransferase [Bacillota bacterium]